MKLEEPPFGTPGTLRLKVIIEDTTFMPPTGEGRQRHLRATRRSSRLQDKPEVALHFSVILEP